ncbi:hypothetical protein [Bacillus mycoides]|uniref:hypothetical protein n=1 Tax=Bacillus mycoides TaxID=1405 RepID=UPI00207A94B5|nr:hypothetical protein [Bacillus mycoides]
MQKCEFLNLNEGDCIYVYSGGKLEAQGRYISVVEDKNESFLCWRKHNGNEVFTNLNGISIETMNENTAYLENTKGTCERGYTDNYNQNTSNTYPQEYNDYDQNSSNMYDQSYNNYNQNMKNTYQPSYDNGYEQNNYDSYDSGYNNTYEPNYDCNYNQEYNTYDQNMENTFDQAYNNNYEQGYDQNIDITYNNNYNQNSGCTCNHNYNNNYPK